MTVQVKKHASVVNTLERRLNFHAGIVSKLACCHLGVVYPATSMLEIAARDKQCDIVFNLLTTKGDTSTRHQSKPFGAHTSASVKQGTTVDHRSPYYDQQLREYICYLIDRWMAQEIHGVENPDQV